MWDLRRDARAEASRRAVSRSNAIIFSAAPLSDRPASLRDGPDLVVYLDGSSPAPTFPASRMRSSNVPKE